MVEREKEGNQKRKAKEGQRQAAIRRVTHEKLRVKSKEEGRNHRKKSIKEEIAIERGLERQEKEI
jgi:hypothetical protein